MQRLVEFFIALSLAMQQLIVYIFCRKNTTAHIPHQCPFIYASTGEGSKTEVLFRKNLKKITE